MSTAAQNKDCASIPQDVFRHVLERQLVKHIRPPTRRDLGTKLTSIKPFSTSLEVVQEQLEIAKALPEDDEESGLGFEKYILKKVMKKVMKK